VPGIFGGPSSSDLTKSRLCDTINLHATRRIDIMVIWDVEERTSRV
jgi:hypothetical protein